MDSLVAGSGQGVWDKSGDKQNKTPSPPAPEDNQDWDLTIQEKMARQRAMKPAVPEASPQSIANTQGEWNSPIGEKTTNQNSPAADQTRCFLATYQRNSSQSRRSV